tara:strand:- start:7813 stop:9606 length:1794 start_codon:yes stop_codon:yes gene_type:complete
MCGYFFYIKRNNKNKISINKNKINFIRKILIKRGPDNFSKIIKEDYSLIFSRLSIIDPDKISNQPFTDSEKRFILIFNGEIYNYKNLKKKLQKENYKFKTNSDTEVLFTLLKYKGIDETLKSIEGMFSFIFFDKDKKSFIGARDHFGQKPFYYSKDINGFTASTNIKTIACLKKTILLNRPICDYYLASSGILPIKNTVIKGIYSLPAGNYIYGNSNKLITKEYFSPEKLVDKKLYNLNKNKSESFILKQLEKKIKKSIKKHLVSDVEIASTLSGGIDSSLIVYYLNKINSKIKTFTNFSEKIESIPKLAVPRIIKKIKFNKKNFFSIKNYPKNYLKKMISLITNSFSPSRWGGGVPMSYLCNKVKSKKIKVLLGGDGVDEYCSGYMTFFETLNKNSKLHSIVDINKNNPFYKKRSKFLKKVIIENYKKKINKNIKHLNSFEKKILINNLIDTKFFLQSCTLPHNDEYSMNESVEMRNPYIDLDLIKFVLNLRAKFKIQSKNKPINKYIFRKLAIRKIGKVMDLPKEGTRNFSKFISDIKYWRMEKFYFYKKKYNKNLDFKTIFKLINLEILYRYINDKKFNYKLLLTQEGKKFLIK